MTSFPSLDIPRNPEPLISLPPDLEETLLAALEDAAGTGQGVSDGRPDASDPFGAVEPPTANRLTGGEDWFELDASLQQQMSSSDVFGDFGASIGGNSSGIFMSDNSFGQARDFDSPMSTSFLSSLEGDWEQVDKPMSEASEDFLSNAVGPLPPFPVTEPVQTAWQTQPASEPETYVIIQRTIPAPVFTPPLTPILTAPQFQTATWGHQRSATVPGSIGLQTFSLVPQTPPLSPYMINTNSIAGFLASPLAPPSTPIIASPTVPVFPNPSTMSPVHLGHLSVTQSRSFPNLSELGRRFSDSSEGRESEDSEDDAMEELPPARPARKFKFCDQSIPIKRSHSTPLAPRPSRYVIKPPTSAPPSRADRLSRRAWTPAQQRILEKAYKENPNPDRAEKDRIAQLIGEEDEKKVVVWFQNKRQRDKALMEK